MKTSDKISCVWHDGGKTICLLFIKVSAISALFWLSWLAIHGSVPNVDHLNLFFWSWRLPFPVSRWFDVLLGPAYALIFLWYSTWPIFFRGEPCSPDGKPIAFREGDWEIFCLLLVICQLFSLPFGLFFGSVNVIAGVFVFLAWILAGCFLVYCCFALIIFVSFLGALTYKAPKAG